MFSGEIVHVLVEDKGLSERLAVLQARQQRSVQRHGSAQGLLDALCLGAASCLVSDLRGSGVHGCELLRLLAGRVDAPSVVFLAHSANVADAVEAMKAGAVEVLTSPMQEHLLCDAIDRALERNERLQIKRAQKMALRRRFETLTVRERQVLPLVIGGLLNRQAAGVLGIAEVTLQFHRAQIMRKMQADSLPDLVRMGMRLGVPHATSPRGGVEFQQPAALPQAMLQ